MSHKHNHAHHSHHHGNSEGNIRTAFFLNLLFTAVEIAGGIWTNSMAIISDALHDLGDSLSLGVAWFLEKYSQRGPDEKYTFGYARFSLLGALINSFILVGGSILILVNVIPRVFKPEPVNSRGMLAIAVLGIVINGLAVLRLRKGKSLNERVVFWHLMEDVLGWAVILIASAVMIFVDIPVLDPILSLAITLYILYHVAGNIRQVFRILFQGVPDNLSIREIEEEIVAKTRVESVHHTHIWSLEGQRNLLSTHIVLPDDIRRDELIDIKREVKNLIRARGIEHVTLEIDFASEDCESRSC
ncbi:MAG: cation transporter [Firmicutes bacterium]|nr:cation transporter [Bacillota bacterium]HOB34385.1 cation diffusion facilitator family transporter [Bacillota bacterium]HPZ90854.1 cation diffusion facilitator family transporter [Bacillota bacterium]HQE02562.1 cation diffusion facilitator family transporter [Bacillota bacterium]